MATEKTITDKAVPDSPLETPKAVTEPVAGGDKAYEALQAELAKVNQRLASVSGSVRKQHEMEALLLRQNGLLDAIVEHFGNPQADPSLLVQKAQAIKVKDAEEVASTRQQHIVDGYSAGITDMLKQAGLQASDPRLANAAQLWNAAQESNDLIGYHNAFLEVVSLTNSVRDEQATTRIAKETAAVKQQYNQENNTLATGTDTRGLPPTVPPNLEALYDKDTRKMNPKELQEHKRAIEAAERAAR